MRDDEYMSYKLEFSTHRFLYFSNVFFRKLSLSKDSVQIFSAEKNIYIICIYNYLNYFYKGLKVIGVTYFSIHSQLIAYQDGNPFLTIMSLKKNSILNAYFVNFRIKVYTVYASVNLYILLLVFKTL